MDPNAGRNGFKKIPQGEKIYIVAFGKKDGMFFYGESIFETGSIAQAIVNVDKLEQTSLESKLKQLTRR